MGNLVLDMSMSLDGFIAGPDDGPDNGLDVAGHWDGDHHDGVPIFVPTHRAPDNPPTGVATITYVTDGIESAVAQAKTAAGDRNVMLHGADTVQRCLQAGVLDEMEIHVVPCCSARVGGCSTICAPTTSNSNSPGSSTRPASRTSTTESGTDETRDRPGRRVLR